MYVTIPIAMADGIFVKGDGYFTKAFELHCARASDVALIFAEGQFLPKVICEIITALLFTKWPHEYANWTLSAPARDIDYSRTGWGFRYWTEPYVYRIANDRSNWSIKISLSDLDMIQHLVWRVVEYNNIFLDGKADAVEQLTKNLCSSINDFEQYSVTDELGRLK
jgi:hypothetical protein